MRLNHDDKAWEIAVALLLLLAISAGACWLAFL